MVASLRVRSGRRGPSFGPLLLVVCAIFCLVHVEAVSLKEKLVQIEAETNKALKAIFDRWEIASYPNFLRSVSMGHSSWEVLKVFMRIYSYISGLF
jgi:hypothetical protein